MMSGEELQSPQLRVVVKSNDQIALILNLVYECEWPTKLYTSFNCNTGVK